MPRGTARMKQWELERIAERDSTLITVRCAHCAWTLETLLGEGREAHEQHRLKAHPHIVPPPRRKRHRMYGQTSRGTTLDQNIAAVREQGGATWDGATL